MYCITKKIFDLIWGFDLGFHCCLPDLIVRSFLVYAGHSSGGVLAVACLLCHVAEVVYALISSWVLYE